MTQATPIIIPLLNPNEPEALLAALHVHEGEHIEPNGEICTLETTKSTQVLTAETAGYVVGLGYSPGQTVQAGEVLGYLAATLDWQPPATLEPPAAESEQETPTGLRITQPALALARMHNLDLALLPEGPLVTETMVRGLIGEPTPAAMADDGPFDPLALIVYGGGGHGKSVIDLLRSLGTYRLVGVIDDGIATGTQILGLPVLGGAEALPGLRDQGIRLAVNAVGGIGKVRSRIQVFQQLAAAGFASPAVVHPRAYLEPNVTLSGGLQVFPHAYIGSECQVGFGVIVNTGAVVSHDCVLEDYANISPGALLAGGVRVGEQALVGMGVTINLGVHIGAGARIGNGATVKSDVPAEGVVRAGGIWPD
jgi:sugar O-acyltransferase (sialic acid O-acetyltransferase NeuD family)